MKEYADQNAVVEDAARIFEAIEKKSLILFNTVPKLKVPIEAGVPQFILGRLKAERMKAEIDAIAGLIGEARKRVYALHEECTKIAQDKEIDLPQVFGGGDR